MVRRSKTVTALVNSLNTLLTTWATTAVTAVDMWQCRDYYVHLKFDIVICCL